MRNGEVCLKQFARKEKTRGWEMNDAIICVGPNLITPMLLHNDLHSYPKKAKSHILVMLQILTLGRGKFYSVKKYHHLILSLI